MKQHKYGITRENNNVDDKMYLYNITSNNDYIRKIEDIVSRLHRYIIRNDTRIIDILSEMKTVLDTDFHYNNVNDLHNIQLILIHMVNRLFYVLSTELDQSISDNPYSCIIKILHKSELSFDRLRYDKEYVHIIIDSTIYYIKQVTQE